MDVRVLATALAVLGATSVSCGQAKDAPQAAREAAAALVRAKMAEGHSTDLVARPAGAYATGAQVVAIAGDKSKAALPVRKDLVAHRVASAFAAISYSEEPAAPALPDTSTPVGAVMALAYADDTATPDDQTPALSAIEALVVKHAEANQVSPTLARALIKVESNYRPRATGRHGEIGLMQISPRTARGIGYSGSPKALYDPETNLAWGMKYLAKAEQLAGGDICGTLLRYNAGLDAKRRSDSSTAFCAKVKAKMGGSA